MVYIQSFNVGTNYGQNQLAFELRDANDNLVYSETNYTIREGMGTAKMNIPSGFKGSIWIKDIQNGYLDVVAINQADVMFSDKDTRSLLLMVVNSAGEIITNAVVKSFENAVLQQKEITGNTGVVSLLVRNNMSIEVSSEKHATMTRQVDDNSKYMSIVLS